MSDKPRFISGSEEPPKEREQDVVPVEKNLEPRGYLETQTLSEVIEAEIRAAGAVGKILPIDILRDFNMGFNYTFHEGVGMRLEDTVDDVLSRTLPAQTKATSFEASRRVSQNMADFIRTAIKKRMRKQG